MNQDTGEISLKDFHQFFDAAGSFASSLTPEQTQLLFSEAERDDNFRSTVQDLVHTLQTILSRVPFSGHVSQGLSEVSISPKDEKMKSGLFAVLSKEVSCMSAYDEMLLADNTFRAAYSRVGPIYHQITQNQPERIDSFQGHSLNEFKGDNSLYPLPRLLTNEEADVIHRGVMQRGEALRRFLCDHYSGAKKKDKTYHIANLIPQHILAQIIQRSGDTSLQNHNLKDNFGFWYGPDIVRGPKGVFYVCEDNLGMLPVMSFRLETQFCLYLILLPHTHTHTCLLAVCLTHWYALRLCRWYG